VTEIGPLAKIGAHELPVRRAPASGEHTLEVLRELKYSQSEIDALLTGGAVKAS
jgi:crotonobetainyl-CoA:carnitine CoA-transferase CaiB-like acyl-CoA transferase